MKKGEISEEDNRVIELVLKGVNTLLVKSGLTGNAHSMIEMLENDINTIFKLSHHKVFRI
jgi:hypothetical protein